MIAPNILAGSDVDFICKNSTGLAIFTVDSGIARTTVSGFGGLSITNDVFMTSGAGFRWTPNFVNATITGGASTRVITYANGATYNTSFNLAETGLTDGDTITNLNFTTANMRDGGVYTLNVVAPAGTLGVTVPTTLVSNIGAGFVVQFATNVVIPAGRRFIFQIFYINSANVVITCAR
jgi:hypothetical protein